ncbi:MAG: DMT family transporter [Thermomicrobiales bacterium]
MTREREGVLLCLLAATCYSTLPILTKYAYRADVTVLTLMAGRTIIATGLYWAVVWAMGMPLATRRALAKGFVVGLLLSSVQFWLMASALARLDAVLVSLLFYSYPSMVMIGAVLLRREQATRRRLSALVVASAGVVLVLSGASGADLDRIGVMLALASAIGCAATFLIAHALLKEVPAYQLGASITTGSAVAFALVGLATRKIVLDFEPAGWLPVVGLALISSILANGLGFAGIARVGPSTAGILMTAEPVLTVVLAAFLLDERLRPLQLLGGLLVVSAVLILQYRRTRSTARTPVAQPVGGTYQPAVASPAVPRVGGVRRIARRWR